MNTARCNRLLSLTRTLILIHYVYRLPKAASHAEKLLIRRDAQHKLQVRYLRFLIHNKGFEIFFFFFLKYCI